MSSLLIRNARLVEPGRRVSRGDLEIVEGVIRRIGAVPAPVADSTEVIDAAGRLVTPGLIDLHTHGIGYNQYDRGPQDLQNAVSSLARFGVTTIIPTLVPRMTTRWLEDLATLAASLTTVSGVSLPGLHLEGPFMAVGGAACPTLPGDLDLLDGILAACGDRLSIMSLSPDTPHVLPIIEKLSQRGILVSLTHTRANVEQTEAAIEAGARHATHFYDVFYPPPEADPGVRPVGAVEVILADPRMTVDFIADGVHVHPAAIRAAVAAKGAAGVILVTDSNIGAGLPPGTYETPWGYPIKVSPETAARHASEGFLAGSALTMNIGVRNLLQWLNLPAEHVWAMATLNPAQRLGLNRKGRLEPGADGDVVLWEDDLNPAGTWLGGRRVYPRTP